ncbi:ATPase [Aureococcus anophagefferens]|nr:ATPase [Aureococcus anophagefferens]
MSDTCLANTWLSTQDKGGSVYRLTTACAELFDCAAGSYCPAGSFTGTEDDAAAYFADAWWPGDGSGGVSCAVSAGRDDGVWAYECACGNGFWCDENTAMPKFCPQGYYCETPAKIKKCPEGYYCKEGSVEPRACKAAQICPRGSAVPEQSASGLVWFVLISLVAYVVFKLRTRYQEDAMRREVQELEDYHDVVEAAERKREAKQTAAVSFEEARASSPKDNGETYKIEFEDIRLVLPDGTTIMRGPSGCFLPGTSTAIMGASGAGKTTIMNLVTGKVKKTSGVIRVNGEECASLAKWRSRVAFVPQEDVMHRELTVLENLEFSANTRLPATWAPSRKQALVFKVLDSLNLVQIQRSKIGDEFNRGISGGQRKRVNVGLELVADPKVLFLDEPTSGLDSVSATELSLMLRSVAESDGLTIAAVIHSPGPAAFDAFHRFLLLQTGGRLVYHGATRDVETYFGSIGFAYPRGDTLDPVADFMMKCVAGGVEPAGASSAAALDGPWDHMTGFTKLWHASNGLAPPDAGDATDSRRRRPRAARVAAARVAALRRDLAYGSSFRGFFVGTIVVYFAVGQFLASLVGKHLNVLGGYSADICAQQYPELQRACLDLQDNSYVPAISSIIFILVAMGAATSAATFGCETAQYWREAASGLHTPAYFLAKVVADAPLCVVSAISIWGAFVSTFNSPMRTGELLAGFVLINVFGYFSGYFLSFLLPYTACGLAAVAAAVWWAIMYSGTSTARAGTIDAAEESWIYAISAPRWFMEGIFYATTVEPSEEVPSGPAKGEVYYDLSRQKDVYRFFSSYSECMLRMCAVNAGLLAVDLLLITATKLDKKR